MADSNRIFRQAALDRLSSPEQLDQLMQVTTPKSWLALVACCVLVLMAVAWGIWGSIRIDVHGRGILIKEHGVFVATAFGDGRVAEILVQEEELVTNGQLLARLSVPELSMKIHQAEVTQQNLTNELQSLRAFQKKEAQAEQKDRNEQTRTYDLMFANYQKQIKAAQGRLGAMNLIGTSNLLPITVLLDVTNSWFSAQQDLAKTRIQKEQLDLSRLQANERRSQQIREKKLQISQGAQTLQLLTGLFKLNSEVRSPISGTVLEITVKPNQLVNANTPILSLQSAQEKLTAWLFLLPGEGKRVATNMDAHLAPVTAKKELFGMMMGKVASVSTMPATPQLMSRVLENPTLVAEFSQEGAPIYVVVDLATATNASGFRWTSGKGPDRPITSGTTCDGTITLYDCSPISLVLPLLKHSVDL